MTWVGSVEWRGDATRFGTTVVTRGVGLGAARVVAGALLVAGALDAAVVAAAGTAGAGTDGVVATATADVGVVTDVAPPLWAEHPMTGTTTNAPATMPIILTENVMLPPA
jgi:hypothetical protein